MSMPLGLAFLPQTDPSEILVRVTVGNGNFGTVRFLCRSGQALSPNPDALFALGLYPASELGVALHVDGAVDAGLLARADAITGHYAAWWRGCRNVPVRADPAPAKPAPTGRGAAVFFSGGVDSSYSLLETKGRISALVTMLGLDVPLSDTAETQRLEDLARTTAAAHGLQAVIIETDVSDVFHPVASWLEHHGSALAAVGHLLANSFDRIIIASSGDEMAWHSPWGSHPAVDPLFGSALLAVEHHGLVARVEKIARVARDAPMMSRLRVCNKSRRNCGHCDKCTFAMRAIEVAGVHALAVTFPPFLPRRGGFKIVDDAFLSDMRALQSAAAAAGNTDIAAEAAAAIAAYGRGRLRRRASAALRVALRITRHRSRWKKAAR